MSMSSDTRGRTYEIMSYRERILYSADSVQPARWYRALGRWIGSLPECSRTATNQGATQAARAGR